MKDLGFALMFKASLYVTNNFLNEAKETSLYRQSIKSLTQRLLKELDKYLETYLMRLDDEQSKHFALVTDTLQTFINVLNTKDCKVVLALLMEYQNGNIMEIDSKKHGKIVKQLNKI